MLGDGECQGECLSPACEDDRGDCVSLACSAGCYAYMLGDGLCQENCKVEECEWDRSDCECSPGCFPPLLVNAQCDRACNTEVCGFDNGMCVGVHLDCAAGCVQSMIGNGRCDKECNWAECEWDGLDCGCAPACSFAEIATCKPECLVPNCAYGNWPGYSPCNDSVKRLTQLYYDILQLATTTILPKERYDPMQSCISSEDNVTWESIFYSCVPFDFWTAYSKDCLYNVGMCDTPTDTCERWTGFGCLQCIPGLLNSIGECLPQCDVGLAPHPLVPSLCVPIPDFTTADSPLLLYVDPDYTGSDSDGSWERPYLTLDDTFELWIHFYVKILLVGPRHSLGSSTPAYLPILYHTYTNHPHNITISSFACERSTCQRPVVQVNSPVRVLSLPDYNRFMCLEWEGVWLLAISNLDFEESPINTVPFREFLTLGSGELSLTNVTFANFTNAEYLITFQDNNRIKLRNVHFKGVQMTVFGAVDPITFCRLPTINAFPNFTYENGLVAYNQAAVSGISFLSHTFMGQVLISNVTFTGLNCVSECALLDADSWLYVELSNCHFAHNFLEAGFFLRVYSTNWRLLSETGYGTLDVSPYLSKLNYNISACHFLNNSFTTGGPFSFAYTALVQNILLSDLHFLNEKGTLISIASTVPISRQSIKGPAYLDPITNLRISHPPAFITIQAIEIVHCTSSQPALIYLYQLPYVLMNVDIIGRARGHIACSPTLIAARGYNFTLIGSKIEQAKCGKGVAGLTFLNYTGPISLLSSQFSNVSSNSEQGSVISISSSSWVLIEDLRISDCANQGCGVLGVEGLAKASFSLMRAVFWTNKASKGGALCLSDLAEVFIEASTFRENNATGGGAILLTASTSVPTSLTITECIFKANQADTQGGGIYVYFYSFALFLHLTIQDSAFEYNKAYSGAALYLSSRIQLLAFSHLSNVTIARNNAYQAAIALNYRNGTLAIASSLFEDNIGYTESCIYALLQGNDQNTISIADSAFHGNTGLYIVRLPYSITGIRFLLSNVTFQHNSGTALHLSNSLLELALSNITHNIGSAIRLTQLSKAMCRRMQLVENEAEEGAAGVQLFDQSLLYCEECVFEGNRGSKGGAVQVESGSAVTMLDSVFLSNQAKDGSALKFILASPCVLLNCSFTANYAVSEGTIALMSTSLSLTNCSLSNNKAEKIAGLILIESNVTLIACQLVNQSGKTGYFLFITSLSSVNLTHTRIAEGESKSSAIYVEESEISLLSCHITDLIGGKGALLYAYGNANVTFSYTDISASAAINGLIYLWLSSGYFHYTDFTTYEGSAITVQQSSLLLSHSSFQDGRSEVGAGLRCLQCVGMSVQYSEFQGLEAARGAAVEMEGRADSVLILLGNKFVSNRASEGGAIYAQDVNLQISACQFINNSAVKVSPVPTDYSALGRGGAIAFIKKDPSRNCSLSISYSRFAGNRAEVKGGAIAWEGKDIFPSLLNLVFSENTAPYGPNVSSFPLAIVISPSYLPQSASGQPYPGSLRFFLVDHFGQTVASDSSTKAGLSIRTSNGTVYGRTEVTAQQGNVVFNDFSIAATPGTNVTLTVIVPGLISQDNATLHIRLCAPGESQVEEKCLLCKAPKYSFDPTEPCRDCPSEAVCKDGANVYPKAGYWRYDWLSTTFLSCPNPAACLGPADISNNTVSTGKSVLGGTCLEGYRGNMCQTCAMNYHRTSKLRCEACSSYSDSWASFIIYIVIVTICCVFIIFTNIKSARKPKALYSVYLKLLMNYLQLVMLMGSFNLSWPTLTKEMLNMQDSAGSFSEHMLTADCLAEEYDENEAFYTKLVLMSCAPIAFVAISSVCWLLVAIFKRKSSVLKKQLVGSGVLLFFLLHPSVMRVMFGAFNCEEVKPGEYWVQGLLVKCWEGKHLTYALTVALPGIIIWGMAVPGAILISLIVYRKKLRSNSVRIKFGFLIKGYSDSRFYWEFIIIYRKLLIISVTTFLSRIATMTQALLALSLLVLSLSLQHCYQPYSHPSLNTMEQRSILVSVATLFFGLYYLDNSLSEGWEYFFFAVTLGVNVYFLQYWVKKFCATFIVLIIKRVAFLNQHFVVIDEFHSLRHKTFTKRFKSRIERMNEIESSTLPLSAKRIYLQKLSRQ